ncbi:MAG: 3'-5' exonuclease domain-containing protein 2 [Bacteroidetes bacterium]|uniref:3'-5' exonuclease n=1 Tax=Candidatus Cryptobacteroides intestinigallinarum TaxID=2840767 RepID=A0A9D9HMJ3_9BACT|nr:3'-5' exonuclease domain-containing protein 2 [Candidatus Cryptobacteroides intestinigallinarum]
MYISSIAAEDIERLEQVSFPGTIHVIDTVGAEFNNAVRYLKSQRVIGFDTETRPCFSASQPRYGVALLQLSGRDHAYLFRINSMGMHRRLCSLLSSVKVIKVGAAVTDDIRGLQKYQEFTPRGFVDLQRIVGDYGIRDRSVKKMTAIILGFRISKAQQLSNWEAETLSDSQIRYAATDAWVCREMYIRLMNSEPVQTSDPELLL